LLFAYFVDGFLHSGICFFVDGGIAQDLTEEYTRI